MLLEVHVLMHFGGNNSNTQIGHRSCSSQLLTRRSMTVLPPLPSPDVSWHGLSHQIRLPQACCGMEIYQKWQTMTDDFQRLPQKRRLILKDLDWRGDGCWNSREAVLRRILNDTLWNIEGERVAEIDRHSPRLLCTAPMCLTNKSAVRLWQRLSNPISSTSKQMKVQISQRRSATAKKLQTVGLVHVSTTLNAQQGWSVRVWLLFIRFA